VGTEIFFGKSEIRLDSPVNKLPDGQIKGASRSIRGVEFQVYRAAGAARQETALL
jgi:hypothetical protein